MSFSPIYGLWIHLTVILVVLVGVQVLSRVRRRKAGCCARCGFDLKGILIDSSVCSECGANLQDRAIRKRLPSGPIKIATVVAVLLVALHGVYQIARLPDAAWLRMTPTSWLMERVATNASSSNPEEIEELHWRWRDGKHSDEEVRRLLEITLAQHADISRPWESCWSQLLGDFIDQRMVDENQYQRVMENAYSISIDCRPAIRRGGYWTWTERVEFTRGFAGLYVVEGPPSLSVEMSPLMIGNAVLQQRQAEKCSLIGTRKVQAGNLEGVLDDTMPGSHALRREYAFETTLPNTASQTFVRFKINYSKPIRVIEQTEWIDVAVHDVNEKPGIDSLIFDRDLRGERCAYVRMAKGSVGLSADMYLTQDGRTIFGGSICTEEEDIKTLHRVTMLNIERDGWDFRRPFSVELRPDPAVADGRHDHQVGQYWAERLAVKKILVDQFRPAEPAFDPETEAVILRSLKAEVTRRHGQLSLSLSFTNLPMPLVFSYGIQIDGRRHVHSRVETIRFAPASLRGPLIADPGSNVTHCDVILAPYHFWEAHTTLPNKPWPYELVIRNVPIETRE